jgi:exopolyphosphatase/guanosine-5'-triphosphate,3'-diphosphate pyrophosphatase
MMLAGIDIGTNATRLLIAETSNTTHRTVHAARAMTRLGQDLERTGTLSRDAQERTVRVLEEFVILIARHSVAHTAVVGTSSLRRAANAAAFVQEVRERTGLELSVISGSEEARLTLLGVRRALESGYADPLVHALVADIGGGSTELIVTKAGVVCSDRSLDLGAVYLSEQFLASDPPHRDEVRRLRSAIERELDAWEHEQIGSAGCDLRSISACVGTAGTITTLAAMAQELAPYVAERVNGYRLSRGTVAFIIERLCRTSLAERSTIPGLEAGREDIILAGAIIAFELMTRCGKDTMLVSDWGLREGIVFDLYRRLTAG